MATQATIQRQIKALQNTVRGEWVKFQGDYHSNAFDSTDDRYTISVTNINGAWFVYAEDHDTDELIAQGYVALSGFKTLREAKIKAEEFGEFFESYSEER